MTSIKNKTDNRHTYCLKMLPQSIAPPLCESPVRLIYSVRKVRVHVLFESCPNLMQTAPHPFRQICLSSGFPGWQSLRRNTDQIRSSINAYMNFLAPKPFTFKGRSFLPPANMAQAAKTLSVDDKIDPFLTMRKTSFTPDLYRPVEFIHLNYIRFLLYCQEKSTIFGFSDVSAARGFVF